MADALVGYSGFVGGTLLRQRPFDSLYRSTNIADIGGNTFDLLVCAGAPAEKWRANKEPEADRASIARLIDALSTVRAREVVLISTVDVYPVPVEVDEHTPFDPGTGHAYGRHRLELEQFMQAHFDATVIRLPGLFGRGLKKNVIFDLLHDNQVYKVNPAAQFQFYDLSQLWGDIATARAAGIRLVNFATEPTAVSDVAKVAFGVELHPQSSGTPPRYDVRSCHASVFGGAGGYLRTGAEVLDSLERFVRAERGGAAPDPAVVRGPAR